MDLISILATVILINTFGTMVVGVGAYAAFKMREKRKPTGYRSEDSLDIGCTQEPVFLKRYVPEPAAEPSSDER